MHYDVGGCVIGISDKFEYLYKEESSKENSTEEVILSF